MIVHDLPHPPGRGRARARRGCWAPARRSQVTTGARAGPVPGPVRASAPRDGPGAAGRGARELRRGRAAGRAGRRAGLPRAGGAGHELRHPHRDRRPARASRRTRSRRATGRATRSWASRSRSSPTRAIATRSPSSWGTRRRTDIAGHIDRGAAAAQAGGRVRARCWPAPPGWAGRRRSSSRARARWSARGASGSRRSSRPTRWARGSRRARATTRCAARASSSGCPIRATGSSAPHPPNAQRQATRSRGSRARFEGARRPALALRLAAWLPGAAGGLRRRGALRRSAGGPHDGRTYHVLAPRGLGRDGAAAGARCISTAGGGRGT